MLFQLELAGCVSEELYEKSIPKECSIPTLQGHMDNLMLCYGLMNAIEKGHRMDCRGCEVTKVEMAKRAARIDAKIKAEQEKAQA